MINDLLKEKYPEKEIKEFVESDQFNNFKKIIEFLYLKRILTLQSEKEDTEVLASQRALKVYDALPITIQYEYDTIISNKLKDKLKD